MKRLDSSRFKHLLLSVRSPPGVSPNPSTSECCCCQNRTLFKKLQIGGNFWKSTWYDICFLSWFNRGWNLPPETCLLWGQSWMGGFFLFSFCFRRRSIAKVFSHNGSFGCVRLGCIPECQEALFRDQGIKSCRDILRTSVNPGGPQRSCESSSFSSSWFPIKTLTNVEFELQRKIHFVLFLSFISYSWGSEMHFHTEPEMTPLSVCIQVLHAQESFLSKVPNRKISC